MGYTERMDELMDLLNKSIASVNKLDYFKKELLKILDEKEAQEDRVSKSIQKYFESINKSLFGISIEKGKVGTIGEIRTWKDGKKYKKMPDGKWVRVYQQQNRSAEISIARLKGRVKNAKSVDELLQIVMANVHRFEDVNGQVLPIVEELKKEVVASKGKLNIGKPTTQEQIKKIKTSKKNNSVNTIFPKELDNVLNSYAQKSDLNKEKKELNAERIKIFNSNLVEHPELKERKNKIYERIHEIDSALERIDKTISKADKNLQDKLDNIPLSELIDIQYEKDSKIDECKNIKEVENLIKSKNWFNVNSKVDLTGIKLDSAKTVFKTYEHFYALFPDTIGSFGGVIGLNKPNANFYAKGGGIDRTIEINTKYHDENGIIEDPMFDQTMYHEMFHCLESWILAQETRTNKDKGFASYIRQKTKSKYKNEDTAFQLSFYAETDASEFCAEGFGMTMAVKGKKTTNFAKEIFLQTYKFIKLYKGKKVIV